MNPTGDNIHKTNRNNIRDKYVTPKDIASANDKANLRREFRDKYVSDRIVELEQRYLALGDLIAKEKDFSSEQTILLRERSEVSCLLSYHWEQEYFKQNPDKTIQEYVELRESMLYGILEDIAMGDDPNNNPII